MPIKPKSTDELKKFCMDIANGKTTPAALREQGYEVIIIVAKSPEEVAILSSQQNASGVAIALQATEMLAAAVGFSLESETAITKN